MGMEINGNTCAPEESPSDPQVRIQQLEAENRRLSDRLNRTLTIAQSILWDWDIERDSLIIECGEQCFLSCGLCGNTELSSETWFAYTHPKDKKKVRLAIQECLDGKTNRWSCEHRVRTPADGYTWVEASGEISARDENGKPTKMSGISQDIQSRVKALADLKTNLQLVQELRERLELALKASKLGVWEWNFRNDDVICDETIYDIYGIEDYSQKITFDTWREHVHPDDIEEEIQKIHTATVTKTAYHSTFRIQLKSNPDIIRHIQVNAVCHYDDEGEPIRMVGINCDITNSVEAERRNNELQVQLQQAQKMEAIGTLAGGIAHDFNNVLGAITGYSELIERKYGNEVNGLLPYIERIQTASKRAKELVNQILAFSRQGDNSDVVLNPRRIVLETIDMMRAGLPSTIRLQAHVSDQIGNILSSPTQINQIIVNLVTNASHALPMSKG
ncbi:MAG: PAS domain-containing protein, partial [Puniceicoccales bacterium]